MQSNNEQRLEDLNWYHVGLSRNTAEALLLANSVEGTFLLRDSKNSGNYAVSARCSQSVKHFELQYSPSSGSYEFGVYTFYSAKELIEHFYQQPYLGTDADAGGVPVVLRYPYPKEVSEPKFYDDVTMHGERKDASGEATPDFHVGSKEGYLTKRGDSFKSWKQRWFVVQKDQLKYYKEKRAKKPQKEWDLKQLQQVMETGIENKQHCFCLVFPKRTIYCLASSPLEVNEWIEFFQWKIDHFKSMNDT